MNRYRCIICDAASAAQNADRTETKESNMNEIEPYVPNKYEPYRAAGMNERTRMVGKKLSEPQFVKVVEPHRCMPPRLGDFEAGLGQGTVWRCGCGATWKVRKHYFCGTSTHKKRKWRRIRAKVISWGTCYQ